MKKLNVVLIAVVAMLVLQACRGGKDSLATADSINKADDTSKVKSDTSTTIAMTTGQDDAKFAVKAANGGMAEVMLGTLAEDKGNAKVKALGAMMVKDHTKANNELMALAKSKNIALPTVVDKGEQKLFDDLKKKAGTDFDKTYISMMKKDHKDDIKEFEDASKNLKDPDLKSFAVTTLPTLKMHLAAVMKTDSLMKK